MDSGERGDLRPLPKYFTICLQTRPSPSCRAMPPTRPKRYGRSTGRCLHTLHIDARHPVHGGPLTFEDARAIYASLYSDISEHFTDPQERMIAAEPCHVGQPVRCMRLPDGAWAATLRLSLSRRISARLQVSIPSPCARDFGPTSAGSRRRSASRCGCSKRPLSPRSIYAGLGLDVLDLVVSVYSCTGR
jgi:hypothetical protein